MNPRSALGQLTEDQLNQRGLWRLVGPSHSEQRLEPIPRPTARSRRRSSAPRVVSGAFVGPATKKPLDVETSLRETHMGGTSF